MTRLRELCLAAAQALDLRGGGLQDILNLFVRLEGRVGEGDVVRGILVDEGLQFGLGFGEGFDLRAVAFVDLLHALQAG